MPSLPNKGNRCSTAQLPWCAFQHRTSGPSSRLPAITEPGAEVHTLGHFRYPKNTSFPNLSAGGRWPLIHPL